MCAKKSAVKKKKKEGITNLDRVMDFDYQEEIGLSKNMFDIQEIQSHISWYPLAQI